LDNVSNEVKSRNKQKRHNEWLYPKKTCHIEPTEKQTEEQSNTFEILSDTKDILDVITVESVTDEELNYRGNISDRIENQTVPEVLDVADGSMYMLFEKSNDDAPDFVHVIDNDTDGESKINQLVHSWRNGESSEEYRQAAKKHVSCTA